jgi:copper chaperone CopZ
MNMKLPGTIAVLVLAIGFAASPVAAQERAETTLAEAAQEAPRQIEVTILGMSCPFCAYGVEQKLTKLDGIEDLEIVLETGIATLTLEDGADVSNDEIQKQVKEAGFEAAGIVRNFESTFSSFMDM